LNLESSALGGPSSWSTAGLSVSGLPGLLDSLARDFEFAPPRPVQLRGVTAWELRGTWNARRLVEMLPEEAEQIKQGRAVDTSALPAHLPDEVIIWLGREEHFPYRITFRRTEGKDQNSRVRRWNKVDPELLTMEFFEVRLNVPVDPGRFDYQPGNLTARDVTEKYLSRLGM
jgi:hypothetical protein